MMKFGKSPRPCFIQETPVVQGLAVTPSEVAKLTERGVAVSTGNSSLGYSEGVQDPALTVDMMRGVDINDVWQAEQDSRSKLVGAYKRDKEFYG